MDESGHGGLGARGVLIYSSPSVYAWPQRVMPFFSDGFEWLHWGRLSGGWDLFRGEAAVLEQFVAGLGVVRRRGVWTYGGGSLP